MIRDRYDPVDLFTQIPQLCLQFEPVLAHLDRLLEDDALFRQVKADLTAAFPNVREGTPLEKNRAEFRAALERLKTQCAPLQQFLQSP